MDKLSLYDLLSILLPGSLLSLFLVMLFNDFGYDLDGFELNDYFWLTIYLSSSFFLGSTINILTRSILGFKLYQKFGLYTPIHEIYEKASHNNQLKPFYDSFDIPQGDKMSHQERSGYIWDEIYYDLEATDKISVPKSFQSFYFFFRNFFTLGLFLLLPTIALGLAHWFTAKYIILFIIILFAMGISVFAASWNRKMMVSRMYWTYYSLHKNNSNGK